VNTEADPGTLLRWYDRHARALPWRVPPAARLKGERPDPYRVWLSEVMLQQTTVATVRPRFERFLALWPTVEALAATPRDAVLAEWAGLGYYARARNLHACARAVTERGGFPDTEAGLLELPGIGAYTAAAIAAIAFDRAATVVDGNVERVMARLFAIDTPMPGAKPALKAAAASLTPRARPGDYAQAVMDLGATICTPRKPLCALCPWSEACAARAAGIAEHLPRKAPKAKRPRRRGVAFVLLTEGGEVVVRRRPETGLLGGMLGLPGTDWTDADPPAANVAEAAPARAAWIEAEEKAEHVFTHFALTLTVLAARGESAGDEAMAVSAARRAMPTALRKALDIGLRALGEPPAG
jgi:A/G-specific adenine glycosylase